MPGGGLDWPAGGLPVHREPSSVWLLMYDKN